MELTTHYVHYNILMNTSWFYYLYLQVSPIQSSTTTTYIPQMVIQNNSLVNIPMSVIGDVSNSTSDSINILTPNDVITNSPLNGHSSTLGAFFMSEMERLTTVKTVTAIDLG